jgi:hypothetical protein
MVLALTHEEHAAYLTRSERKKFPSSAPAASSPAPSLIP